MPFASEGLLGMKRAATPSAVPRGFAAATHTHASSGEPPGEPPGGPPLPPGGDVCPGKS